nr:MAG TPA: hypothetical protein [Caudoviricetes sp.]
MKILTKQKQREIEKYIVANLIIANDIGENGLSVDSVDYYVNNAWNALNLIGGSKATDRAVDTIIRYFS